MTSSTRLANEKKDDLHIIFYLILAKIVNKLNTFSLCTVWGINFQICINVSQDMQLAQCTT